jgi:hypothetical protein
MRRASAYQRPVRSRNANAPCNRSVSCWFMRPSSATVRFAFFGNQGLVDRRTLVLGQNTCKRHDQNMRTAGLMDEFTVSAVTVQFAVAA